MAFLGFWYYVFVAKGLCACWLCLLFFVCVFVLGFCVMHLYLWKCCILFHSCVLIWVIECIVVFKFAFSLLFLFFAFDVRIARMRVLFSAGVVGLGCVCWLLTCSRIFLVSFGFYPCLHVVFCLSILFVGGSHQYACFQIMSLCCHHARYFGGIVPPRGLCPPALAGFLVPDLFSLCCILSFLWWLVDVLCF